MKTLRIGFAGLMAVLVLGLVFPAAAQTPVKVTWWTEVNPTIENINADFVEPFNAAHPDIQLEVVPQEKLDDSLRTAIQAGEAPDILQTAGGSFISEFVPAGVVAPMDAYAEKYDWKSKLQDWAYQSGFLDGKLYSIPLTYETMILMYNKALFAKNGWKPPTTRAEMDDVAAKMQAQNIHPFSYGYVGWEPTNEHLVGIYLNNYAGPDNVYKAMTGEKKWTDPEFVDAIKMLKADMVDKGYFSGSLDNYYAYGWDDFFGELAGGQSGMMMIGTWGFRGAGDFFKDAAAADWDWVPIPPFSDMAKPNYELAIGSTLSINAASKNPDAAAVVLDYLMSNPATTLKLSATTNFGEWVLPLHYKPSDFPEGTDERVTRFHADFAKVTGEGNYGYTTWTFWPADPDVQLWKDIELVWAGSMTPEDYLAKQQALWEKARADKATLPIPQR